MKSQVYMCVSQIVCFVHYHVVYFVLSILCAESESSDFYSSLSGSDVSGSETNSEGE